MANEKETLILLGKKIRKFRRDQEISQDELAVKSNISRGSIQRLETGEESCSFAHVVEVCSVLGIRNIEIKD